MNTRPQNLTVIASAFALLLLLSNPSDAGPSDPGAISSATPSPTSELSEKLDRKAARSIRRTFIDILDQESDKLRAEQKRARREGDAGRKAQRKEWDARETTARRKFFNENAHGSERRGYVHDLNDRRKVFYDQLKDEERQQKAEHEARRKALKEAQKVRLESLEGYLKRFERPPSRLLEREY